MKQNFIQPKLPETDKFIVPYGGSGTILLNREPSGLEVLNDINEHIYTFFKVMQDRPRELIQKLEDTPYHEAAFRDSFKVLENPDEHTDLRVAHAWFIRKGMAYNAGSESFAYSTKEIRRDRSQHVSRFRSKISDLDDVAERLRRIQFMCRDAIDIMDRFDKDGALQYLDPPYPQWVRSGSAYEHEMGRDDHQEMLETAQGLDCMVAISTYENDLYNDELSEWTIHRGTEKGTGATNDGSTRTEVLYTNYD